jgi:hypothetical protein
MPAGASPARATAGVAAACRGGAGQGEAAAEEAQGRGQLLFCAGFEINAWLHVKPSIKLGLSAAWHVHAVHIDTSKKLKAQHAHFAQQQTHPWNTPPLDQTWASDVLQVSNSQFMFPASSPDPLAVVRAEPAFVLGPAGEAPASSSLPGLGAGPLARPASKKYKVSAGGSSSAAGTRAASRDLFSRGSSGENAAQAPADSAAATPAGDRSSSGEGSTAASATAGPAAASDSLAAAAAGTGSSVAAVGLGAWGSQRSSQDSSCSSSDAVSPTGNLEPVVTLTPSTDEARPPVSR